MSEEILKVLLSLLGIFAYSFFIAFFKKKKEKAVSQPVKKSLPDVPKAVERAMAKPKAVKRLTDEANPLVVPKKKKGLLRGKSKREAFILSEVLRNPYSF